MKSLLEIRKFAVEMAVTIMGNGCPCKDVVSKAEEIEKYVVGKAELPEFIDENEQVASLLGVLAGLVLNAINPLSCNPIKDFKVPEEAFMASKVDKNLSD